MKIGKLIFRAHAIERMFEREINAEDVCQVISEGVVIEDYPDDAPYPSCLIFGWGKGRPIHVVAACNANEDQTIVITVYVPDPDQWDEYVRRKKT